VHIDTWLLNYLLTTLRRMHMHNNQSQSGVFVFRLQWRTSGSWWIRQSTDACRHGWEVWPQDTRVAAVTGLFTCLS